MDTLFKIVFDFSLDGSSRVLQLEAMVELKYSAPHYKVNRISRRGQNNPSDLLPEVDIKCIVSDGGYKWVHTDSGKETYLSNVIGAAIEKTQGNPKIADENDDPEEEI
jgi:hypothetical protein